MAHKKNLYHKSRYYRERQKQLQKVFFIAGGVGGISVSILGLVVYNLTNTGGKK